MRACVFFIGIVCMRDSIVYARVRVIISERVFDLALYENVDCSCMLCLLVNIPLICIWVFARCTLSFKL